MSNILKKVLLSQFCVLEKTILEIQSPLLKNYNQQLSKLRLQGRRTCAQLYEKKKNSLTYTKNVSFKII